MANTWFITILVTILLAVIAYFLVDETTLSHLARIAANKTNVTESFGEQGELLLFNATQNDTSIIFNITIDSNEDMTMESNSSNETSILIQDNKANETEIRENVQAKSQIVNETIESITQESQPNGDQAAQSVDVNQNSVSIESDFPPDVEAVVYSEIEHQNGLLMIPRIPDPKSQFMRKFALSYPNGTDFQHDSYSTNYSSCPITSQIILNVTNWTFQTLDEDGKFKTRGGDEWFILYEDQDLQRTTCVAHIIDHEDGQYSLKFTASPYLNTSIPLNEKGKVIIWLEYTCGVGAILRPFKDTWRTNGAILTKWTAEDVPRPPMSDFINPNVNETIDFGKFDYLLGAGDSVMQHFVSPLYNHFYFPNMAFGKNIADPLLGRTVPRAMNVIIRRLRSHMGGTGRVGLILGYAAWELQKPYGNGEPIPGQPYADNDLFPDHLNCLRTMISRLRRRLRGLEIFWKTGEYIHLHVVARDKGKEWVNFPRLEYMSRYRTMKLYNEQKEVMHQFGIPILDVMEASYLMPDRHRDLGDAIHYDVETNQKMLSWFFPNGLNMTV